MILPPPSSERVLRRPVLTFRNRTWNKHRRIRRITRCVYRGDMLPGPKPTPQTVRMDTAKNGVFKVLEPASVTSAGVDVTFKVPFRVEVGESIVICGNCPEFGNWRVQFAFPLTWTPGNMWTGELRLDDGQYEFKCVRVRVGGTDEWEVGENRILSIQDTQTVGNEMEMTMEFGETRSSSTIMTIRETVVMGPTGDELFRVSGGIYNLVELEHFFQPTIVREIRSHDDDAEFGIVHDVTSKSLTPSVASMNQYLRSVLLLEEDEITLVYRRFPNLRFKSIESDVKPWVQFFQQEVGLTYYHIATLLKRKPSLLDLSISQVLKPFADFFLNDLGVLSERFFKFLCRRPSLVNYSLENDLKPKVKTLRSITELENWEIGRIVIGCGNLLTLQVSEIRKRIDNLMEELKLDIYECTSLILRFPPLLSMNSTNVAKKIRFLTQVQKRSVSEIVGFPFCLSFSLEERIMKRFQYLSEVGLPHHSCSLRIILSPPEVKFLDIVQKELNKDKAISDDMNNDFSLT
eukprot:g3265.t1